MPEKTQLMMLAKQALVVFISLHIIFGLVGLLALIMSADVKQENMQDDF